MNWEQKLHALKKLSFNTRLEMRSPGDWYVQASMQIPEGQMLRGAYGEGPTPEAAVEAHWVIYGCGKIFDCSGKQFRWNGFMWEEV